VEWAAWAASKPPHIRIEIEGRLQAAFFFVGCGMSLRAAQSLGKLVRF
jgi:hypothetical protein